MNNTHFPRLSSINFATPTKYPKRNSSYYAYEMTAFNQQNLHNTLSRNINNRNENNNKLPITLTLDEYKEKPNQISLMAKTQTNINTNASNFNANANTTTNYPNTTMNKTAFKSKFSFRNSINTTSPHMNYTPTASAQAPAIAASYGIRVFPNALKTSQNIMHFRNISNANSLFSLKSTKIIGRTPGPFEVAEDDKIFNELRPTNKKKSPKRKVKLVGNNINDRILFKIYQIPAKTTAKIQSVKRHKDNYPLAKYQNCLLTSTYGHFSKESVKSLSQSFMRIWNMCNSKIYEKNYDAMKELEEYEEVIIKKLHRHENALKNIIINSKDTEGHKHKLANLPQIKFTKVFNK